MACLRGLGTQRGPPCFMKRPRRSRRHERRAMRHSGRRIRGTAARHAQNARRALTAFKSVQDAVKPETTTAKRSARKTLPKSADWLSRAYEAATDAQKPAVAVLWASGCRPAEIAMGVDVSKRKGGVLVIEIPGAKVKDDAGQPRRSIAIREDSEAGKALLAVLATSRDDDGQPPGSTHRQGLCRHKSKDRAEHHRLFIPASVRCRDEGKIWT